MVYMPGVPTFFKCISIMSVMKKSFCVGEMKKKKAEMSVFPNGVTKYTDFGLHVHEVVKCSNFTLKRVKV